MLPRTEILVKVLKAKDISLETKINTYDSIVMLFFLCRLKYWNRRIASERSWQQNWDDQEGCWVLRMQKNAIEEKRTGQDKNSHWYRSSKNETSLVWTSGMDSREITSHAVSHHTYWRIRETQQRLDDKGRSPLILENVSHSFYWDLLWTKHN